MKNKLNFNLKTFSINLEKIHRKKYSFFSVREIIQAVDLAVIENFFCSSFCCFFLDLFSPGKNVQAQKKVSTFPT